MLHLIHQGVAHKRDPFPIILSSMTSHISRHTAWLLLAQELIMDFSSTQIFHLNFALRSAISYNFWFFTSTMETSMYLAQSVQIESSNHVLLVERLVTKPLESTWMDWGFLPFAFQHCISSSIFFFETDWTLNMLLVWTLMGGVICAPPLAPKLRLGNVVKRGLVHRV